MEDFETIADVLQAYKNDVIDFTQAQEYISALSEWTEDTEAMRAWEDDEVRNRYICAALQTLPPNATSDTAAAFIWDVAQRLMDLRARKVGITLPDQNTANMRPLTPEEMNAVGQVQAQQAAAANNTRVPFPATGTPPQMPEPVQKWGDGTAYGDGEVEHDDGPY